MALNGKTIPYVPPAASPQQQIAALNRIIDIINSYQQQIVFADGQNKRMLIGYQENGWGSGKDFGIKISQEGVDVATASDDQLLFSMDVESWVWYNGGIPNTLVGASPDDGRAGIWTAKPGQNVKTLLGG